MLELLLFILLNVLYFVIIIEVHVLSKKKYMRVIESILPHTLKRSKKNIEEIFKVNYIECIH